MRDIQNLFDERGIAIQKVGVSDVYLPFLIKTKSGSWQTVLAEIKLMVDLPQEFKGTHMSRFIEVLSDWSQKPISSREIKLILQDIMERLDAQRAEMSMKFKYFVERSAPVTGLKSLLDCDCSFAGIMERENELDFILGFTIPYTSVCPCSKEISEYGAHNQRGVVKVRLRSEHDKIIWFEDLADVLGDQGSCPVYPLLKREDEKFVTEVAYENPKFVEDILRDAVISIRGLAGITWFEVECKNYESIHNHSAFAAHTETVS